MLKFITRHLKRSRCYNEYLGYRDISLYSLGRYEEQFTSNIKKNSHCALIGIYLRKLNLSKSITCDPEIEKVLDIVKVSTEDFNWCFSKITTSSEGYVWLLVSVDDPAKLVYLKMSLSEEERFEHVEL